MTSGEHPQPDEDVERSLTRLLDSLGQRLGRHDRYKAQKHIGAGEYGLALERVADGLCDADVAITREERHQLLDLARLMDSGQAAAAIELCPEAPSERSTWWDAVVSLGRRVGRGTFYVSMAAVFCVSVMLGIGTAKDAMDRQQVIWGTFSQANCEPTVHGCRSVGRWVSDDGAIVKDRIYLDGLPGDRGSVRASYQPAGLINDSDNNIVHVESATGMALWFPWVLAAFSLGYLVYYTVRWRRETSSR